MLALYHFGPVANSLTPLLCLLEKNLEFENRFLDSRKWEHHDPAFQKLSADGMVPLLVHNERVVRESTVINEYIDSVFPSLALRPQDPWLRSEMRVLTKYVDEYFCPALTVLGAHGATSFASKIDKEEMARRLERMPNEEVREKWRRVSKTGYTEEELLEARRRLKNCVARAESQLARNEGWLLGEFFSLADIKWYSMAALLPRSVPDLCDPEAFPAFHGWLTRMADRPAVKALENYRGGVEPTSASHRVALLTFLTLSNRPLGGRVVANKKTGLTVPAEGMIIMRLPTGLLRAALLLPVSLLLGTGAGVAAQENHADEHGHGPAAAAAAAAADPAPGAMRTGRWSDPATWPERKVPRAGDAVTIGKDMHVVLDVDPPALRSLTVDGKLSFSDDLDIGLETEWIYLRGGELQVGSEARPYRHNATITLTDTVRDENINTMGDRGIMLMGGTLSLHGDREHTWTKLAQTAAAGSNRIEVLDARGWRKGDEIVLASTDFNPRQAEKRTVAAIAGNVITLDRPLQYMHFGKITYGVDERGEVGLLTRNIRIQASDDAESSYFGGHIMAMAGSQVQVSGVELSRMGQHLHLARYPMHWHLLGEGQGQYLQNSSIHDTYSRCVTVHGTNNVRVENNVTFNTVGHCFFLEDAVETGNQFVHNLGIMTKCHPTLPCEPTNLTLAHQNTTGQSSKQVLIPSDNTVSTFWITNPDNIYRDNVAAGSDQIGFWMAFPQHPTGSSKAPRSARTPGPAGRSSGVQRQHRPLQLRWPDA